jgi:PTS system mannitol-specific IIA component
MTEILTVEQIKVPGTATTKDDAIREAGGLLVDAGAVRPEYVDAMFEREKSVSTYMGNLLAIPHGTNEAKDAITSSALSVVRYDAPIDWDGNAVRFAVGVAGVNNGHVEILSRIAILFADLDEVEKLVAAASAEELYTLLAAVNEGDES